MAAAKRKTDFYLSDYTFYTSDVGDEGSLSNGLTTPTTTATSVATPTETRYEVGKHRIVKVH